MIDVDKGNESSHSGAGGAIYCEGGTVTINRGKISFCGVAPERGLLWGISGDGGAICCKKGTVNINGGEISNCAAYKNGGAIRCLQGTVNINGGEISNCIAGKEGGAIWCYEATLNMTACWGGAIYLERFMSAWITEGRIIGCSADEQGNAIYVQGTDGDRIDAELSLIEQKNSKLIIEPDPHAKGQDTDSSLTEGYKGIYLSCVLFLNSVSDDEDGNHNNRWLIEVENFEQLKDAVRNVSNGGIIKLTNDIDVGNAGFGFDFTCC